MAPPRVPSPRPALPAPAAFHAAHHQGAAWPHHPRRPSNGSWKRSIAGHPAYGPRLSKNTIYQFSTQPKVIIPTAHCGGPIPAPTTRCYRHRLQQNCQRRRGLSSLEFLNEHHDTTQLVPSRTPSSTNRRDTKHCTKHNQENDETQQQRKNKRNNDPTTTRTQRAQPYPTKTTRRRQHSTLQQQTRERAHSMSHFIMSTLPREDVKRK